MRKGEMQRPRRSAQPGWGTRAKAAGALLSPGLPRGQDLNALQAGCGLEFDMSVLHDQFLHGFFGESY